MDKKITAQEAAKAVLQKAEQMLKSSKLAKSSETKHDRCVEHVKENSPEVKNPHAVCVAEGVKPEAWTKSELDVTPADGVQKETIGQHDPAAEKENMNPPWGTEPGHYKLARFMGHRDAKRKQKPEVK